MKKKVIDFSLFSLLFMAMSIFGVSIKADTSLYRLYNPTLKVHLYTKDTNEYAVLANRGWNQEGLAWLTSDDKGDIVYRLYHSGLKVHLYTRDANEYRVLATRGWKQEGPAYRSYGKLPIYRLYNTFLKKHLYTRDANEYKILATRGWKQEGIAFYGLSEENKVVPPVKTVPSEPVIQTRIRTEVRNIVKFKTIEKKDPTLPEGQTIVVTKGHDGYKKVRITEILTNGVVTSSSEKVIEEVAVENRLVRVGTKKVQAKKEQYRKKVEEIPFKTVSRKTDDLFEGETREVTKGSKGRKVTTYKETYIDGKLVKTEVVGKPVITPAVDRVIEVGTKKVVTTTSVDTTEIIPFKTITETDDQLEEGQTKVRVNGVNGSRKVRITRTTNNRTGETTENKEVISETPAVNEVLVVGKKPKVPAQPDYMTKTSLTLDEFEALTEEQQDAFLARNNTFVSGDSARKGDLNQAKADRIEALINLDKLNNELVRLINEARASEGLSAVTYAGSESFMQVAANTRANEMADYGSLHYGNAPEGAHKRPDGSKFSTVYSAEDYARMKWRGENSIQFGSALSSEKAANEITLANTMFEEWMASPGHRAIMFKNLNNIQIAVGIGIGVDDYNGSTLSGVTIGMLMLGQMNP